MIIDAWAQHPTLRHTQDTLGVRELPPEGQWPNDGFVSAHRRRLLAQGQGDL